MYVVVLEHVNRNETIVYGPFVEREAADQWLEDVEPDPSLWLITVTQVIPA